MDVSIASGSSAARNADGRSKKNKKTKCRTPWFSVLSLVWLLAVSLTSCALAASPTSAAGSSTPSESLHETLLLKPLPDGRVLSSFEFTLTSSSSSTTQFRLLPRALLQPIQHFGVSEVHLSLNSGRWRYNSWGSPVTLLKDRRQYTTQASPRLKVGEESVGTGAELWARFDSQATKGESWKGLTSALAGLFCTSLDALDERQTVEPRFAFANGTGQTMHALLPTEGVCTENLTPFLKLLPCKNSAGLATLLNPLSLFSASFHGLAVHVERLASTYAGQEAGWQVKLTFTSVFSPAVTRDVSIRDWSISSLFGRSLDTTCPLADSSLIRILKPNDAEESARYQVEPLPPFPACSKPGDEHRCSSTSKAGKGGKQKRYDFFPVLEEQDEVTDELAASGLLAFETQQETAEYEQRLRERWSHYLDSVDGEYLYDVADTSKEPIRATALDVKMSWPHETRFTYPSVSNATSSATAASQLVQVERTLIGTGQERTTLQVTLTNTDPRLAQRVLWYESLGYFVQPYLHTLSHTIDHLAAAAAAAEDELLRTPADYSNPVERLTYQPTRGERGSRKPFVLEAVVRMPARSRVVLTIELKKAFVPYSRHPPDAHRGFDLNGGIVFPLAPVDPRQELIRRQQRKQQRQQHQRIDAGDSTSTPLWNRWLSYLTPQQHKTAAAAAADDDDIKLSKTQARIYTLPRLVELATPDFSFVYTNIIFTSTVMALFFGSTLNTLLRTFTDFVL